MDPLWSMQRMMWPLGFMRLAAVADERFGHDGLVVGLVMAPIGGDGAVPVDLGHAWAAVAHGAVQSAGDGGAHGFGELAHEFIDDFTHDEAGGVLCFGGEDARERNEAGDEMDVGRHRFEHFGLEKHFSHAEAVERFFFA